MVLRYQPVEELQVQLLSFVTVNLTYCGSLDTVFNPFTTVTLGTSLVSPLESYAYPSSAVKVI